MERKLKNTLCAGLALLGLALAAPVASAVPLGGLDPSLTRQVDVAAGIDKVRWVCGPYRCFWRPNRYFGYYRPLPFWGGHPGWHRGWHGGWGRGYRRWHGW